MLKGDSKMRELTLTTSGLTPTQMSDFGRFMIGFDHLINHMTTMDQWANSDAGSRRAYPPYNVIKRDEDHYVIELAVAGFGEQDLEVTVHNGTLYVTGNIKQGTEDQVEYLYRGLSRRKFQREFRLVEYVDVTGVTVQNGIMTIELERQLPEALKPRSVAINFSK